MEAVAIDRDNHTPDSYGKIRDCEQSKLLVIQGTKVDSAEYTGIPHFATISSLAPPRYRGHFVLATKGSLLSHFLIYNLTSLSVIPPPTQPPWNTG